MTYTLNLKFVNGETKTIALNNPHRLSPDNLRPHAMTYMDDAGNMHNIPFSSLLDFWFSIQEYNECEKQFCATCQVKKD